MEDLALTSLVKGQTAESRYGGGCTIILAILAYVSPLGQICLALASARLAFEVENLASLGGKFNTQLLLRKPFIVFCHLHKARSRNRVTAIRTIFRCHVQLAEFNLFAMYGKKALHS